MGNVWNTSFGAGSNHSSAGPGAGGDSASNTLTSHSRKRPREKLEDEEVEELSPRRLVIYFLHIH